MTARVKAAESQIAGLTTMKEQWEAHRAAQEFAKQIKKLEEVSGDEKLWRHVCLTHATDGSSVDPVRGFLRGGLGQGCCSPCTACQRLQFCKE